MTLGREPNTIALSQPPSRFQNEKSFNLKKQKCCCLEHVSKNLQCVKHAVSESTPLPSHGRSISPSPGLLPLGMRRLAWPGHWLGQQNKPFCRKEETRWCYATKSAATVWGMPACPCWVTCHIHRLCLHPSPIISVLSVSHQRRVLTLSQRRITNLLLGFH